LKIQQMAQSNSNHDLDEDAAELRRLRLRQRRPVSHKAVLVFLAASTIGVSALLAGADTPPEKLGIVVGAALGPLISITGIVAFRLSKVTYLITSACLLSIFILAIGLLVGTFQSTNDSGVAPRATSLFAGALGLTLTGLLAWRYTFGAASRTYYGFGAPSAPTALPKSIPPKHRGRSRSGAEAPLDY
jgi:hypothetical protein